MPFLPSDAENIKGDEGINFLILLGCWVNNVRPWFFLDRTTDCPRQIEEIES